MAAITIEHALQLAASHYRAGRLADAETLCRQILAHQPQHHPALHRLGMIAIATGRFEEAVQWISEAIRHHSAEASYFSNLGIAYHRLGRSDEAIGCLTRAAELHPDSPEIQINLGDACQNAGRFDAALTACERAVRLRPNYAEAWNNMGIALIKKGELENAKASFQRALQIKGDYAGAHRNLGVVFETYKNQARTFAEQRQWSEAIGCLRAALTCQADDPDTHHQLGNALYETGQLDEAITHYRRALAGNPDLFKTHNNLGNALYQKNEWDEAIACYRRAVALSPDYPEAHTNLGVALYRKGMFQNALSSCRRAIGLHPDFAHAHDTLASILFLLGQYEEGWKEHAWRWRCAEWSRQWRDFAAAPWDGQAASARRIWLYTEQGYGDTIQFIRYLPLVHARAGAARIFLVCPPGLERLLAQNDLGQTELVVRERWLGKELTAEDRFLPLLSLPATLQTWEPLPMERPYLHADAQLRSAWRERLGPAAGFRVGLAWAGSPTHKDDRNRSIALQKLASLLQLPGFCFVSLQVAPCQPATGATPTHLLDLTAHIADFADTAALMAELDLIITVDTAAAHLAGALGRSVWTLLPFMPDWRWGLDREDTPWYPTMRLFRQKTVGDWDEVIQRVVEELSSNMATGLVGSPQKLC